MMKVREILDKIKPKAGEEEFLEVQPEAETSHVSVKIDFLNSYADVDRIRDLVRDNNVVFLKIGELRKKDMAELKRAVEKLKKTCVAMEGDMVGVDEDFLIVTPKSVRIYRGKAA
jgi:hypothetical protein